MLWYNLLQWYLLPDSHNAVLDKCVPMRKKTMLYMIAAAIQSCSKSRWWPMQVGITWPKTVNYVTCMLDVPIPSCLICNPLSYCNPYNSWAGGMSFPSNITCCYLGVDWYWMDNQTKWGLQNTGSRRNLRRINLRRNLCLRRINVIWKAIATLL